MRPRFSLRTFFLVTTLVAALCYYWFALPTLRAKQFVSVITHGDFQAADAMFIDPGTRFIHKLASDSMAFEAQAGLRPWTFSQILHGERLTFISIRYFAFDQNNHRRVQIAARPNGLMPRRSDETTNRISIGIETPPLPIR